jgi:hypothetical protein
MAKLTLIGSVVILFAAAATATSAQQIAASTNAPGQEPGGKSGASHAPKHKETEIIILKRKGSNQSTEHKPSKNR